ncbi:MAG TPA: MFS transporter, partial [Vicinamibacterales bacterium]|nr:MFS transporter [Vicinamibacterales bacterium]
MLNETDRGYAGWRAAWACAAGSFFASFPYYSFAVFLRPVSEEFGWSRESMAGGFAAMALVAAVSAPIVGRVIDRLGARRVILPALTVIGLAVISLSMLTGSRAHLYAVCAVIGCASIGASAVAYSRVIFGWFDRYRGRALGLMLAGGMISTIVLPPAVAAMIRSFGWRTAWLTLGIVIVLIG